MATITNTVRWADNTAELKANLLAGIGTVEALKSSVDRTAASMGGQGLFLAANKLTAAIDQLGGVTKLTAAEQDRASATLDKAIEKYKTMGMTAPPAMVALADSMKKPDDAAAQLKERIDRLGESVKSGIEDPMGTAKGAVVGFVTELGPLGIVAVAAAGVLAAVGAAAFELSEKAVEVGERLQDFSYKTSISVEAASALDYAATVAGSSLDQMGSAIFMMQKRMADDSSGAFAGALEKIHLSVQEIEALTPDQQFIKIAEAFKENTTQTDRASVAMALFGRAGRDLAPLLMKDLGDLTNQAKDLGHVMSGETAKGLEDLGMAWRGFKEGIAWTTTEVGVGIIHFFQELGSAIDQVVYVLDPFSADLAVLGKRLEGELPKVKDIGAQLAMSNAGVALSAEEAKAVSKELDDQIKQGIETRAKQQAAIDGVKAALEGDTKNIKNEIAALDQLIASGITDEDVKTRAIDLITKLENKHITLTDRIYRWDEAQRQVLPSTQMLGVFVGELSDRSSGAADTMYNLTSAVNEFHDGISIAGDQIATVTIPLYTTLARDILPQATAQIDAARKSNELTWGDRAQSMFKDATSILGHIGGTIGQIAEAAVRTGQAIMKNLADGNVWGAVVAGVTGAVSVIAKLFGGVSKVELEGRKVEATFEQSFGGFQGMMTAVGGAYDATGRSAAQAQADVAALMAAEKLGGDAAKAAIDKINQAFDEQKQDAADLDAAIQKYGFSIEQLGPAMQKQKLDDQAKTLINDWRLLVASGIDVVTVDQKMASSTWDYLQMAKKTGQEVPEAMKPVIQSMLDQGVFTDENGQKITDMKNLGITFSETMTQGFDKVVAKLQQLLDKIGLVPAALASASGPINVDVNLNGHWNIPDVPANDAFAAGGGLVTGHGVQYLAGGGNVLAFQPRGTDTVPAMLTPGEGIVSRRGMSALGTDGLRVLNRGGGSGSVVDFSAALEAHGARLERKLERLAALQQQASRTMPAMIAAAVAQTSRRR